MFGIDDAVIGGIGSALIGGIGSLWQSSAQQASADKQMDFQKEMSNTAYQRATADMKAAGLNPMLAYTQGGASSAAGAQANVGNPGEAFVRGLEGGSNSAKTSMTAKLAADNIAADSALKGSQNLAAKASAAAAIAQAKNTNINSATAQLIQSSVVEKALYDAGIAGNTLDSGYGSGAEGKLRKKLRDTPVGSGAYIAGVLGQDANNLTSAFSNIPLGNILNQTFAALKGNKGKLSSVDKLDASGGHTSTTYHYTP